MKFKKGDVVECIEPNKSMRSPNLGEHCVIRGYYQKAYGDEEPLVKLEGISAAFYEWRFKLVEPAQPTINLPF